ncbi:peroxisomal leader peptide-processing protease-like [Chrysoperla carnea]|uniref:peroxisomal leader peptide-processing protease-like n=1 Tax=Chrysoperla carnea TaxID=189513 RepID=UPI001D085766|nr:peroxisomal leader peptide-processing protease-like [Chrysoperla carnea]
METEGVLIQYETKTQHETYFSSGLMLNKSVILTTGACLAPFIQKCTNNGEKVNVNTLNDLLKCTIKYNGMETYNNNTPATIESEQKIIKNNQIIYTNHVNIVKMYNCTQIETIMDHLLPDWDVNHSKEYQLETVREFILSIIIVLKVQQNDKVDIDNIFKELLNKLVPINYLERGDVVFLETTPFGNQTFLNSYSEGIIANTIGQDQCLYLTDASSAPGSEGGPIFLKKSTSKNDKSDRIVVGLVLSSISFWKDEWCGFTLGVSLASILQQIIISSNPIEEILFEKPTKFLRPESIDNSILKIFCGSSWGSGVLLNKQKGIVVTTSHTIKCQPDRPIFGKWKKELFKLELLYKTSENFPYDIAILQTKSPVLQKMKAIKLLTSAPAVGEDVLAFGFPFEIQNENNNLPTISRGSVAKSNPFMLQTTCCIHRGVSGGAIVRPNGELLGIVVCITATNQNQTAYPHINMAVPIQLVIKPLKEYLDKGDKSVFNVLETHQKDVQRLWNLFNSHL